MFPSKIKQREMKTGESRIGSRHLNPNHEFQGSEGMERVP